MLLALDPGTNETGYVVVTDDLAVCRAGNVANDEVVKLLIPPHRGQVVCEDIKAMGMPIGDEVLLTAFWIGRFCECARTAGLPFARVTRRAVKLHVCGSARAKDRNIRQALIDLYGPGKDVAVGTKAAPGPLYRVKEHAWQALATAVTWGHAERSAR
jgi:Holliday junction resolvasome RuvABC endonuclease subunit